MTWLAVHPDNTMKERVPDDDGAPIFEFGFWPPRVAERINSTMAALRQATSIAEVGSPDFQATTDLNLDLVLDMVRYSVRGWTNFYPAPSFEEVEVDRIKYKKLDDQSMRLLHANGLQILLSEKSWLFNVLSETQKKTSGLRLGLDTSIIRIAAESVPSDGKKKPSAG